MRPIALSTLTLTAAAIFGFCQPALATQPASATDDLILITNSNGSISLIIRDPRNRAAPYFEAE